jgi:hypothetical protein
MFRYLNNDDSSLLGSSMQVIVNFGDTWITTRNSRFPLSLRAFFKDFSLGVQKFLISKFLIVS